MSAPIVKINDSTLQVVMGRMSSTWKTAVAVALNRTRDDVIADQIPKMKKAFIIRAGKERFLLPPASAPAAFRATEQRLYAPVALAYDDGKQSIGYHAKRILEKHGATQDVPSRDRLLPFFRPTPALRPTVRALVPQKLYPRFLVGQFDRDGKLTGVNRKARLTKQTRRLIRRRGLGAIAEDFGLVPKQYKTRERVVGRYFILGRPGEAMHGIYQRVGPGRGRGDIVMLWDFMQSQRVTKRLNFEPEARQIIAQRWAVNFDGAFQRAMSGGLGGKR